MFELIILAAEPFKSNFIMDIVVPGLALLFVLLIILNSLLNKFGYTLW